MIVDTLVMVMPMAVTELNGVETSTTAVPVPCSDTDPQMALHPRNAISTFDGVTDRQFVNATCQ